MKVTVILPDNLIEEVKEFTKGKNLTEGSIIALKEWSNLRHIKDIKELNKKIEKTPLKFSTNFNADNIRELNRRSLLFLTLQSG